MLAKDQERLYTVSEADRSFYGMLLPREHPLLDALELIDWQAFVPELESYYCPSMGQSAIPPLLMLKLRHLEIKRCLHLVLVWFCIRKMRRGGERYLNRGLRL